MDPLLMLLVLLPLSLHRRHHRRRMASRRSSARYRGRVSRRFPSPGARAAMSPRPSVQTARTGAFSSLTSPHGAATSASSDGRLCSIPLQTRRWPTRSISAAAALVRGHVGPEVNP